MFSFRQIALKRNKKFFKLVLNLFKILMMYKNKIIHLNKELQF